MHVQRWRGIATGWWIAVDWPCRHNNLLHLLVNLRVVLSCGSEIIKAVDLPLVVYGLLRHEVLGDVESLHRFRQFVDCCQHPLLISHNLGHLLLLLLHLLLQGHLLLLELKYSRTSLA